MWNMQLQLDATRSDVVPRQVYINSRQQRRRRFFEFFILFILLRFLCHKSKNNNLSVFIFCERFIPIYTQHSSTHRETHREICTSVLSRTSL